MKQVFGQPWRAALRTAVEQGGGKFVGIQEGLSTDLVLFNDEAGSTLALKVSEVTPTRVFDKIKASNRKFAEVK